jgi:hypothetical protein
MFRPFSTESEVDFDQSGVNGLQSSLQRVVLPASHNAAPVLGSTVGNIPDPLSFSSAIILHGVT